VGRDHGSKPLVELAKEKWKGSGLNDRQATRGLRLEVLTGAQTAALASNFLKVGSLKIPYWTPAGKPTKFFRIRYLEKLAGFAGTIEKKKQRRYAQPEGTLNDVYLPPLLERSWEEIFDDAETTIYITEGELKAAAGCAVGLATVGLGGVDVWKSSKRGLAMLPSLAKVKWDGRQVVIAFDSDAAVNPDVVRAQRQLATELLNRGALPGVASLPPAKDGAKQGLDDFLVARGAESLEHLLKEAPAFPEAEALWSLSEEVVYVRDPGMIIVRDTGQQMKPHDFTQHAYANRHYVQVTQTKDGGAKLERKALADRWMEWEHRFEMQKITYAPGEPQLTCDATRCETRLSPECARAKHASAWNIWRGWGIEPKRGDVAPWKWLLDFLFQHEDANVRKWFERWCAFPLQHPGIKMFSSAVLWGVVQGTGKTLVGHTLMRIYGKENSVEIGDEDLEGNWNTWARHKQFIYGDEVTGKGGNRKIADRLKRMITRPDVTVKVKYVPEYVLPDLLNYLFTSQHPDAFFIEDTDRRFFVHEVVGAPAEPAMYQKYDRWLKGDGPSHLFDYLLRLDLGDFDPRGHALRTRAKEAMIVDNKSDLGLWVANLKEDPTAALAAKWGRRVATEAQMLTATQLLQAYDPEGQRGVTVNGLARELKRAGFRQAHYGDGVKTHAAGLQRLYAIRHPEKWISAAPAKCAAHFDEVFLNGKLQKKGDEK
jgi:hypothetical protein